MPDYEERQAARFGNYNWSEWCTLTKPERALGVAYYRMQHLIELHVEEAHRRKQRLDSAVANVRRSRGRRR